MSYTGCLKEIRLVLLLFSISIPQCTSANNIVRQNLADLDLICIDLLRLSSVGNMVPREPSDPVYIGIVVV